MRKTYETIYTSNKTSSIDRLLAKVPNEKLPSVLTKTCEWKEDIDMYWNTACHNTFVFNDGGIKDNNFKYCPFCGKEIKEVE